MSRIAVLRQTHSARHALMILTLVTVFAAPARAAEPNVVVTIKPIHSLVAQIMDGVAEPKLVVDGSASPHSFSLKPSAAKAINTSDLFIRVSPAVEPFTEKLISALPKSVEVLTLADVAGITLLNRRQSSTFEAHDHGHATGDHKAKHAGHEHHDHKKADHDHAGHSHDHDEANAGTDGHIWLDTINAEVMVATVAADLSKRFPEHAAKFAENATATTARIKQLHDDIASKTSAIKGRPFIMFHDAMQYFEKQFGLEAAGSITMSPEQQPSAKRLKAVREKIASLDAVCVFAEPSFQPKLVAAVTEKTTARSGVLDPEGLALSPGPGLYSELMQGLAQNLATCLNPPS
jgi:zinc transport system substrate-binding protein